MSLTGFFADVANGIAGLPERLNEQGNLLLLFTIGGAIFWMLSPGGAGKDAKAGSGLRAAIGYVFRRDLYASRTSRADLWNFALFSVLIGPVLAAGATSLTALFSADLISGTLTGLFGPRQALVSSPGAVLALQVAIIFLATDFALYVEHWLLHRVPVLWSWHRAHHSAETLNFFTRLRLHPVEHLFRMAAIVVGGGVLSGTLLFAIGTPIEPEAIRTLGIIGMVMSLGPDLWRHSHVPISFGPLNRIICAPVMHQLHHSAEERHHDRNMGANLMIFDWLFGTLYLPDGPESYRLGLDNGERGANNPHASIKDFYLEPFRHARQTLFGR